MNFWNLFPSAERPAASGSYSVELRRAEEPPSWGELFSRVVSFPFEVMHRIYNTYLLITRGELRHPVSKNTSFGQWVTPFGSLFFSMKVTSIPEVAKVLFKQPRKNVDGLFDDRENRNVYAPLLRDMYPSEAVTDDDFLLTCNVDKVHGYRTPILRFVGPTKMKEHAAALEEIAKVAVESLEDRVNAGELALTYTTSVISKLLLGHPGPMETYREIAHAVATLNTHATKSAWRYPISAEEEREYGEALDTVREAIKVALNPSDTPLLGSLVSTLRDEKGMSDLQIKTTLFLMYLGGSETTSSLLTYLLWQLGQHPEYQQQIFEDLGKTDSLAIDRLFAESIRLFTPAYVMGRQPAANLIFTVKDGGGNEVFRERIGKDEGILYGSTFAARDPNQYLQPDTFNPNRFDSIPTTLPWLPFSDGKHACPGQWLAKAEINAFVAALVQKYTITSSPTQEPKQEGQTTLKLAEDVYLSLIERSLL